MKITNIVTMSRLHPYSKSIRIIRDEIGYLVESCPYEIVEGKEYLWRLEARFPWFGLKSCANFALEEWSQSVESSYGRIDFTCIEDAEFDTSKLKVADLRAIAQLVNRQTISISEACDAYGLKKYDLVMSKYPAW